MECTQAEAFEQYIRDLRVVRSISRPSFPEGKAPAAVLEEIQTNALRCNTLMRQNEALLAQFVYDRDPASLTEEDIQGLSAFAGRLFNYANSEDMGVAFKVHQLLLAAARSREEVPMIVRELYYCWVSVKQFSKNDTATACQDWLRSTRLGRGSIKSHVRTVKVLGMGLFAFQERVHLWKGVTH